MLGASFQQKNLKHIWYPCSQMKDYESFLPLSIKRAAGSYLELTNGKKIIDAISSWWCKSLGHNHPRLKRALINQINCFEHVILANTTNETITLLSEKLAGIIPSLTKIFYAGDGSCAIEIAMKMSLHARQIKGENRKTKFIALKNSYHGETMGALSVSDIGNFKKPYRSMLFDVFFISEIPYLLSNEYPVWLDCSSYWENIEKQLRDHAETTTALIVEPIIQGVGGMKLYSQDFLTRLRQWTSKHNIHLIADEVMTGLGRTGKMVACQHANVEPDFLCLGKGLTAGWMAFSAVLTRNDIYEVFYDEYQNGNTFFHSHTYSGNVLAASVALEALNIIEELKICEQANKLGEVMFQAMSHIANETEKLTNVRQIGAIVAADLIAPDKNRRYGFEVFQKAVELGAFLRPLGNTIYWLPPLNTEAETIESLYKITRDAICLVHF